MRLVQKIVTIIWVGSELKRIEGKSVEENDTLVHLPNKRGGLISSSKSFVSHPKSNGEMGDTKARSKKSDYGIQVIIMCDSYVLGKMFLT